MTIAVLCLIAGTLLSYTSAKQSGPFQAASWHEAGAAAEGGVEIALNALRRSIDEGTVAWNGWQNDPSYGATAKKYITEQQLLSHAGEGNTSVRAIVEITQPTGAGTINPSTISPNRYAYLIRSTGFANVPGPSRLATDKSDLALRKLNVFRDFRTASTVTTPQVSRVVEAIASPVTPFPTAILSKDTIEIKGGAGMVVDSYDPTVTPYKYDATKTRGDVTLPGNKRSNGNIATNAKLKNNQDVIRLENVSVYGLAAKGAGVVNVKTNNASISGEVIDGFYRELKPVQDPSKIAGFSGLSASDKADRPSTKKGYSKVVQVYCGKGSGGSGAETSYYKFSKIHLHKDEILKVSPFNTSGQQGGYAEVWVTGDIVIHNQGLIQVDNGAHVTFYCAGNVSLEEKDGNHPAIDNDAVIAKNADNTGGGFTDPSALQFYGVVLNNKKKNVKIKTNMSGVIYAPDHEFEVNLKSGAPTRHVYGALTGRKFKVAGASQIHYDESLADVGKPFDYTLETWQEDWYDPAVRKTAP